MKLVFQTKDYSIKWEHEIPNNFPIPRLGEVVKTPQIVIDEYDISKCMLSYIVKNILWNFDLDTILYVIE